VTKRICVIDADASFRKLCGTLLKDEGFECDFVSDFVGAPAFVAATRPDLVIMDLALGEDVDGVAILRELKSRGGATPDVPVLICSAARQLVGRHGALLEELGCETLDKPFSLDDLLGAIDRCLAPVEKANGAL
jgi:DNA-binding response OmpR family regulator